MAAPEAVYLSTEGQVQFVAAANHTPGEVIQLADGRAGVIAGLSPETMKTGDTVAAKTRGRFRVKANTTATWAAGAAVGWDATANEAVAVGDFKIGEAETAKANGETTAIISLNDPGPSA